MQLPWLHGDAPFPPTANALGPETDAPGLLAAGGDLSVARLVAAYSRGIFPWFGEGQPLLWWSTSPRMVLPVAEFKLSRSLRKALQRFLARPGCEIRFDTDTPAVIRACAGAPREGQDGTWIVPAMVDAYERLHRAGIVHSVETWADGELIGGLYGVNLGRMFYGESMFARRTDASKFALAALVAFCRAEGIALVDCQQETSHLASLGARPIQRTEFERHIQLAVAMPAPARWAYDSGCWAQLGLTVGPPASPGTPAQVLPPAADKQP
jgi:leucyl/phenylalanyl-tRNA--protein transferase